VTKKVPKQKNRRYFKTKEKKIQQFRNTMSQNNLKALKIVVEHDESAELLRLRQENDIMIQSFKGIHQQFKKDYDKYSRLVSLAVRPLPYSATRLETIALFPEEVKRLRSDTGDWRNGFNNGMLASINLYRGMACYKIDEIDMMCECFNFDIKGRCPENEECMVEDEQHLHDKSLAERLKHMQEMVIGMFPDTCC